MKAEREDWQEWKVDSAGTWAREGDPAAKNSQLVLAQRGVDISGHRSKSVTRDMLADYALILTMEPGHKEALQVEFPEIADRVFMLSEMAGESSPVMDPYGGPLEEYEQTAKKIEKILERGIKRIIALVTGTS